MPQSGPEAAVTRRSFAVTRARSPRSDDAHLLDQQAAWRAHADFMDALAAEGFVVLGGPLDGTSDVLLIAHARDPQEIAARLSEDPWARTC